MSQDVRGLGRCSRLWMESQTCCRAHLRSLQTGAGPLKGGAACELFQSFLSLPWFALYGKIPRHHINQLFKNSLSLVQLCNFLGTIEIEPFEEPVENVPEPSANRARLRWVNYFCHPRIIPAAGTLTKTSNFAKAGKGCSDILDIEWQLWMMKIYRPGSQVTAQSAVCWQSVRPRPPQSRV